MSRDPGLDGLTAPGTPEPSRFVPPPSGWYTFGTHAGRSPVPPLEFMGKGEDGLPLFERPRPTRAGQDRAAVEKCQHPTVRTYPRRVGWARCLYCGCPIWYTWAISLAGESGQTNTNV